MIIMSKKKFEFRNTDGDVYTTKGFMNMENAPEWITKARLYALAVADGDIIAVNGAGTDKDAAEAAEAADTTEEHAEAAEADAADAAEPAKKTAKTGK